MSEGRVRIMGRKKVSRQRGSYSKGEEKSVRNGWGKKAKFTQRGGHSWKGKKKVTIRQEGEGLETPPKPVQAATPPAKRAGKSEKEEKGGSLEKKKGGKKRRYTHLAPRSDREREKKGEGVEYSLEEKRKPDVGIDAQSGRRKAPFKRRAGGKGLPISEAEEARKKREGFRREGKGALHLL